MFHAFVIVCAASFSEIYLETCFRLDDDWGPYRTEENCYIRSNQMTDDVLVGDLNMFAFNTFLYQYGSYPPMIYAEAVCERSNETIS